MTGRRPSRGALAAALAGAVGAWFALGIVAPAAEGTGARIGVLPPWWILAALGAATGGFVAVLRLSGRDAAPLLLPLAAVLPWLPGPVPPAWLAWSGPLAQLLLAATVAALAAVVWPRAAARITPRPPAAHLALAFGLAAALYAGAGWRMAPVLPGGDEPHYLVIAQSLLHDGDLRIEDNHRRREYLAYFEGELRPDYLRRGRDREIYSVHAPGLPALVVPAFAAAGYPGVVVFLSVVSAAGMLFVWTAAWRLSGSLAGAWAAWAAAALTVPFFFQGFTVYPDGPAAVLVAGALCAIWTSPGLSGRRLALTGAALALLPWLHTRYALLAGALGMLLAARVWGDARAARTGEKPEGGRAKLAALGATAFAIPAGSALAWLATFQAIYGTWSPAAPYGGAPQLSWARVPAGLSGVLIDQQFGLLPNAPVLATTFVALAWSSRRMPRLAAGCLLVAAPYALVVAGFHMWWGGHSTPGRFLVPVLPALAILLGPWYARASRAGRAVFGTLLVVSILLTCVLAWVDRGALAYNWRDGFARWLEWASPGLQLATAWPSLFQGSLADAWRAAAAWAAAAGLGLAVVVAISRRTPSRGVLAFGSGVGALLTFQVGLALAWSGDAVPLEPGAARIAVAAAACGGERPFVRIGARAVGTGTLGPLVLPDASGRRTADSGSTAWSGRHLPPGRYQVVRSIGAGTAARAEVPAALAGSARVWPDGDEPPIQIAVGRPELVIGDCGVGPDGTPCSVELPAGADSLFVRAPPSSGSVALAWMPLEHRPAAGCDARARRATRSGAAVFFTLDAHAAVEPGGLWVLGGRAARLVVQLESTAPGAVPLVVRNGPVPNTVELESGGWRASFALAAGETRELAVPRGRTAGAVPLTVGSRGGFVPAAVDAGSRDYRRLGVWLEAAQNLTVPPK